jgi:hypothetical protein
MSPRHFSCVLPALSLLALGACATMPATRPVEVTRYHADIGLAPDTIAVQPPAGAGAPGLEFGAYAGAVSGELAAMGYRPAQGPARYTAVVTFSRAEREGPPRPAPFSIGLGAGGYSGGGGYRGGGGIGLGGGVSFPVGHSRPRTILLSRLFVQIRDGASGKPLWEGNAETAAELTAATGDTDAVARRLAHALFLGFPGESGRTIEVK